MKNLEVCHHIIILSASPATRTDLRLDVRVQLAGEELVEVLLDGRGPLVQFVILGHWVFRGVGHVRGGRVRLRGGRGEGRGGVKTMGSDMSENRIGSDVKSNTNRAANMRGWTTLHSLVFFLKIQRSISLMLSTQTLSSECMCAVPNEMIVFLMFRATDCDSKPVVGTLSGISYTWCTTRLADG
jgi:hypothetical protein